MMFSLSIIDMKTYQYIPYDEELKIFITIEATQLSKEISNITSNITESDEYAVPARMCNESDFLSFSNERIS